MMMAYLDLDSKDIDFPDLADGRKLNRGFVDIMEGGKRSSEC